MSISVLKVREPRLDIKANREYIAMMGGSQVTTKSYTSDTASNSQILWSITTPSVRVGLDRRLELDVRFKVSLPGATLVPTNFDQLGCGLRQYPLHSIIEVANVQLNDQAMSYEPAQLIHGLLNYGNDTEDRQYFMGTSPHKPDVYWDYDQGPGNAGTRNPFSTYFNSGEEDSRNLKYWVESVNLADNSFVVRVVEELMMAPFYWGKVDHQCLFGIQNLDVTLTLGNIKRALAGLANAWVSAIGPPPGTGGIFQGVVAPDIANLQVDILPQSQQNIHLTFITPQPDQEIPRLLHYPYYQVKRYTQDVGVPVLSGQQFTVNFNNITLHEIPKRMYIFAKPRQDNTVTTPDFFASIKRITINFDNQDGRLSTLDSYDLWKVSAKNGLKRSYLAWSKVYGSVLCLEFGTDLNLNPLLCSSVRGNFQYSAEVTFQDVRDPGPLPAINYRCQTVMIPEGILTVEDQLVSISVGTLTEEIVANSPFAPQGFRVNVANYYGAGFFSNLWSAVKSGFKHVAPVARGIASVVGDVAPMLGPKGQAIGVGARAVNKALGGRRTGGARIRTSSLANRL